MKEILIATFVLSVNDLAVSKKYYMEKLGFAEDLSVAAGHSCAHLARSENYV